MERSAETTRDDPDGEYLKRNRWFESGSLQCGNVFTHAEMRAEVVKRFGLPPRSGAPGQNLDSFKNS